MAIKSLVKKYNQKKADGGTLEPQDPLEKKVAPPVVKVVPASAYDPALFQAGLASLKGKPLGVDKTGMIKLPKGVLSTQVPALTTSVKTTQDYLYDYMKANKKDQLTSAEADALLQKNNMGTYSDYINQAKNLKAYRDLTVVPSKELNQSVEKGGTYNPVMGGGISMEPTIPFDSTHYEYLFPKDTYVAPQKKKNGGGIKGYIEGGDIQDSTVRDTSQKNLSTKPKDYLHDTGLGIIDWSLQGIGAQDVIKSSDYNTKQGVATNRLNSGVGAVGSAIGGAVLDYYVPGLGTAVRGGKKGVGKMAGEDTGISDKDKETIAKVDALGNVAGGLTSMVGGRGKSVSTPSAEATTPASTVDENGIDTTTGEIATQTTAPVTQVTDGSNLTGQALTDWKSALTGEAKQSVLDKYNAGGYAKGGTISASKAKEILHDGTVHGKPLTDKQRKFMGAMSNKKADGGKIVGKGTAKSDSIKAKPEEGSFIVPAENAKKAEAIRAKYLGEKTGVATLNKGGGVDAMLSNGEHMFTKDEADLLRAKGVDLDALAPNADSSTQFADGGGVPTNETEDEKIIRLAEEADARRKQDALRQKNASEYSQNRVKRADIIDEKRNLIIEKEKALLKLQKIVKNDKSLTPAEQALRLAPDFFEKSANQMKQLRTDIDNTLKEKQYYDNDKNFDPVTHAEIKKSAPIKADTTTTAPVKTDVPKTTSTKGVGSIGATPISKEATPTEMEQRKMNNLLNPLQTLPSRITESTTGPQNTPPDQMQLDKSVMSNDTTKPVVEKKKFNPFEKMDVGQGLALAQIGLGTSELLKDGKRPVDEIPADYLATVSDAQKESQFGLSPLQMEIANRGIEKNRAADAQTIINLSGGSAGTALANIRAASIAANDAQNNLSAQSEALRLQKKRYYDSNVAEKAGMSKQLFNEKLNAFNVNQEAGAGLLGAGIQNLIGGARYQKDLEEQKKRESMSNPTFNIG